MCKTPKPEKTPAAAPDPQQNASSISTPTLDMRISNQKRGKRSLSLRRGGEGVVSGSAGVATDNKSGLGTPA
jgi:hypothetical protein